MFVLLPYAHEKQTLQRLPWVTFGLIALNFLIFLFTHYSADIDEKQLNADLTKFYEYYYAHPYLQVPVEIQEMLSSREADQLELLKEGQDLSGVPDDTIKEEQEHLDKIVQKLLSTLNDNPFRKYGYIPKHPEFLKLFSCLFIHIGWMHLLGNMLFLYLAGCSIEDVWGRPLYIGFYFLSGIAATLTHHLLFSDSNVALVGASGAIAGLMGAFLLRLYKTKITFFYLFWIVFRFQMGSFQAPAYVMLPLWLLQQILFVLILREESSIAFWAHIGGFGFGFLFAFLMKTLEIEEKYIAPSIEKKVSLVQNPLFLKAMTLSDAKDYPNALLMLQNVVKKEPGNLDAYLELRRIAEINKDTVGYNKYTAAIFEILLRTRDLDFLLDLYHQYEESPLRQILPAKTEFTLASFFEEQQDFPNAIRLYEEIVAAYPEDALAMKSWNKLARLYLERLGSREKAIDAFRNSYEHKLATEDWRTALQQERKRFEVPLLEGVTMKPVAAIGRKPTAAELELLEATALDFETGEEPDSSETPELERSSETQPVESSLPIAPDNVVRLPDRMFDGKYSTWTVVPCQIERVGLKGLFLRNERQMTGTIAWKQIRYLSVARVPLSDPSDTLVIDLITFQLDSPNVLIYRTGNSKLNFEKMFPGVEQTYFEAFQNFIGIVLANSGARCVPDKDHCLGPIFPNFSNLGKYESEVRSQLRS